MWRTRLSRGARPSGAGAPPRWHRWRWIRASSTPAAFPARAREQPLRRTHRGPQVRRGQAAAIGGHQHATVIGMRASEACARRNAPALAQCVRASPSAGGMLLALATREPRDIGRGSAPAEAVERSAASLRNWRSCPASSGRARALPLSALWLRRSSPQGLDDRVAKCSTLLTSDACRGRGGGADDDVPPVVLALVRAPLPPRARGGSVLLRMAGPDLATPGLQSLVTVRAVHLGELLSTGGLACPCACSGRNATHARGYSTNQRRGSRHFANGRHGRAEGVGVRP